jgi:predicted  nucleic acid-binding Zn-ribbon protein
VLITRIQSLEKETTEEAKMENDFEVLKGELEAQWKHSETMNEKISEVEMERDAFKTDVELLKKRIDNMEVEWSENENRKSGLENEFRQVVSEKNEVRMTIHRKAYLLIFRE